ncbi:MAG TPA: malate synthase A [Actinomycetes bacterium]|nr:malate synthase A [Actinomycetes bacterium]
MSVPTLSRRVELTGPVTGRFEEVLTPDALAFVADLHARFADRRCSLLQARRERRARIDAGADPHFLPETAEIRADSTWQVAAPAAGLSRRHVEITGPVEPKMAVNALNSGADVWMADLEDATSPTWANIVGSQLTLMDVFDGTVDFTTPEGKEYRVGSKVPTITVRPRGWHLPEKHVRVDGAPISASLFDFGLYVFHCARRQLDRGAGPYLYLPKLQSHHEARLWNDVFVHAQEALGMPLGTIRATVLIETIHAAFEMEEILFELRDHSAGLNAGRWDYIFSVIKAYAERGPKYVLPDRADITMTVPFMRAYTERLVQTCHRRGAHAIGGMAAFIPDRRDPEVTQVALAKVRADKEREAGDGFDGSWVAHPDLVPVCREVFDRFLGDQDDQRSRRRPEVHVTTSQLLSFDRTPGTITEAGLRGNIRVALRYLDSWLRGNGAAAIDHLMEDAATAEISRSQVWQWIRWEAKLTNGRTVDRLLVRELLAEEYVAIEAALAPEDRAASRLADARAVFDEVALGETLPSFLTTEAYAKYLI